jgi:hypothetical protein
MRVHIHALRRSNSDNSPSSSVRSNRSCSNSSDGNESRQHNKERLEPNRTYFQQAKRSNIREKQKKKKQKKLRLGMNCSKIGVDTHFVWPDMLPSELALAHHERAAERVLMKPVAPRQNEEEDLSWISRILRLIGIRRRRKSRKIAGLSPHSFSHVMF